MITPTNDEKYKAATNPDTNASSKTTRVQEVKQALQKKRYADPIDTMKDNLGYVIDNSKETRIGKNFEHKVIGFLGR